MKNTLVLLDDSHFIIDMMYARHNNMFGSAIYEQIGFGNKAYMHPDTCAALLKAVSFLEKHQLKMRVCDAYRPPIAHQKMLEIIPYEQAQLLAQTPERSNHCHGTAVDVCLTDMTGKNFAYPTEIDAYDRELQKQTAQGNFSNFKEHFNKARQDYQGASSEQIHNREQLKKLMESIGFESILNEWWHYNLCGWQNYPLIEW